MPIPKRTHPNIPDHQVLRKIGHGAYGEVWMARGVTGAMRAVKIVWREDFKDERTFEREFEGILKYEPISRNEPGLLSILHVGRSPDTTSFYYYVMELGDDVHTGQEINPVEYEPRTLSPDSKASDRLDTPLCIDIGLSLSEALHHLHEGGLAHRDVKPSNIIFVNGKAKLADIGLVASHGQRTFVGTEGFVPPEGPGSPQADIYSLGKVLYEIATGKDRLDFPELPDELPTGPGSKRWLALNEIICDICEPRVNKRKITSAAELATVLSSLKRGKPHRYPRRHLPIWAATAILFVFSGWAAFQSLNNTSWNPSPPTPPLVTPVTPAPESAPLQGLIRIVTIPDGAEVFDTEGELIGITPTSTIPTNIGSEISYLITKEGYRSIQVKETVGQTISQPPGQKFINEPILFFYELKNFSPPNIGKKWNDHLGTAYLPKGESHISSGYIQKKVWEIFLKQSKRKSRSSVYTTIIKNGKESKIVLAQSQDIIAFSDWIRTSGIESGFLAEDNEVFGIIDESFPIPQNINHPKREKLSPFHTVIREYVYGAVQLTSQPPGADVFIDGHFIGTTHQPLSIPKVKPGNIEILIVSEGYKPLNIIAHVAQAQDLPITATLKKSKGVVFGTNWQNGIGMKFSPTDSDIMTSIWETRIKDYSIFLAETNHPMPKKPNFTQDPNHPIVYTSRKDAAEFCKWLTQRERKQERISQSHQYRLPTDKEWSKIAGLDYEIGSTPSQRDANKPELYTWGKKWPPPKKSANYADTSAITLTGITTERTIPYYNDKFPRTSPVGSFPPNKHGLFDISGNVQEWVSDDISKTATNPLGVIRGGGWSTYLKENLLIGWRNPVPSTAQSSYYGFRIVLSRIDPS